MGGLASAPSFPSPSLFAAGISFRYWDLLFDPVYPSLVLLLLTAGITFYIYRQVETQRAEVRSAFRRYLALKWLRISSPVPPSSPWAARCANSL